MPEDPQDEIAEKAIRKEKKWMDPYENSIDPPGLEGTGLGKKKEMRREFVKGEENEDPEAPVGESTFEDLSSDKEKDSTEGEITDTDESA
jgi:hypothetical protein